MELVLALRNAAPRVDANHRGQILSGLEQITTTDETAVLAQVKALVVQEQSMVLETIPQTRGDIFTHDVPTKSSQHRRVLGTWGKRAAIIAGILTVIWTGIQILDKFWPPPAPSTEGAHRSASESPTIQKLEQFGIVTVALGNFFADMHMTPIPFEAPRSRLRGITELSF